MRYPRSTRSRAEGTSPRSLLRIKLQRLLRRKLWLRLQLVPLPRFANIEKRKASAIAEAFFVG
jgi:hypothetical protein